MMTVVMFMMLMTMRTMTSSISHVRASACAYQICRATLRLQLFASWPRWRWCVSQFLNKDFLQNFVSRANWHISVVYKHCHLTFSGHDCTELTNNVTWAREKATSEWNQGKGVWGLPLIQISRYSVPCTMKSIICTPCPNHTTPSTLSYISLLPGWWYIDSSSPTIRPPTNPTFPIPVNFFASSPLAPLPKCPTEPFLLRQTSLFCPSCVDLSYAVFYK